MVVPTDTASFCPLGALVLIKQTTAVAQSLLSANHNAPRNACCFSEFLSMRFAVIMPSIHQRFATRPTAIDFWVEPRGALSFPNPRSCIPVSVRYPFSVLSSACRMLISFPQRLHRSTMYGFRNRRKCAVCRHAAISQTCDRPTTPLHQRRVFFLPGPVLKRSGNSGSGSARFNRIFPASSHFLAQFLNPARDVILKPLRRISHEYFAVL